MSKTYIPAALRRQVYERAKGCCEYCLIPDVATFTAHEIDHIIAEKHGGRTESGNLALSCAACNKYKGSDLASINPATAEIVALYNPRKNIWSENFRMSEGNLVPLTISGQVTASLLRLNRSDRVEERQILVEAGLIEF